MLNALQKGMKVLKMHRQLRSMIGNQLRSLKILKVFGEVLMKRMKKK